MHTESFNHHPGQLAMNTGVPLFGRPSIGAWLTYGLGSMSRDLPGYVVLSAGRGTSAPSSRNNAAAFPILPPAPHALTNWTDMSVYFFSEPTPRRSLTTGALEPRLCKEMGRIGGWMVQVALGIAAAVVCGIAVLLSLLGSSSTGTTDG